MKAITFIITNTLTICSLLFAPSSNNIFVFAIAKADTNHEELLNFDNYLFNQKVRSALDEVGSILDHTRSPTLLGNTQHSYDDKYSFVEHIANSALVSYRNVLRHAFGLDDAFFQKALGWYHKDKSSVELLVGAKTWSTFAKEEEHEEESPSTSTRLVEVVVHENSGSETTSTSTSTTSSKVLNKVWISHYTFYLELDLVLKGKDEESSIMTIKSSLPFTFKHMDKGHKTLPSKLQYDKKASIKLNFLLEKYDFDGASSFKIDRNSTLCKTPSRNTATKEMLKFASALQLWSFEIQSIFYHMQAVLFKDCYGLENISFANPHEIDIFDPIVPLVENGTSFTNEDMDKFFEKQIKTFDSYVARAMEKARGLGYQDFMSTKFIALFVANTHLRSISISAKNSIAYIEDLLMTQLHSAVGKHLTPADFEEFMRFHNKRFFNEKYVPKSFSHAVRRPGHYPDGVISIEPMYGETKDPIETLMRLIPKELSPTFSIPINPSSTITLEGNTILHGWMRYDWYGHSPKPTQLIARAHQFSSFLLVLGVMGGSDTLLPKHAIIVQDKDEVFIPLLAEILPSTKEFKDAISSLSQEQREFAKAFRSMQLETSVFGLCVVQLKPQLEALLNIPPNSLSKEIRLTQDLMSLFIEYQIPSDLLSFDGDVKLSQADKLETVKSHVKAVMDIIDDMKNAQLQKAKEETKAEKIKAMREESYLDSRRKPVPSMAPSIEPSSVSSAFASMKTVHSLHPSDDSSADSAFMEASVADSSEAVIASTDEKDYHKPKITLQSVKSMPNTFDPTSIPIRLDKLLEEVDIEGALKSTIIKVQSTWNRLRKENILVSAKKTMLAEGKLREEKNRALDLLTAISRSGSLPIIQSELHIVVAVSQCFQSDVVDTVIKENINPIKKVENSVLMLGTVIHNVDAEELTAVEIAGAIDDKIMEDI